MNKLFKFEPWVPGLNAKKKNYLLSRVLYIRLTCHYKKVMSNVKNCEDEICSFCVRQEKEFPGRGCMYPGMAQLYIKYKYQKVGKTSNE